MTIPPATEAHRIAQEKADALRDLRYRAEKQTIFSEINAKISLGRMALWADESKAASSFTDLDPKLQKELTELGYSVRANSISW